MKVLISPGYGAGWSTWNSPEMAVDERLIEAFENGISEEGMKQLCEELGYESYMGGFEDLEIVEVPSGSLFKIRVYDGYESIEVFDDSDWLRAIQVQGVRKAQLLLSLFFIGKNFVEVVCIQRPSYKIFQNAFAYGKIYGTGAEYV